MSHKKKLRKPELAMEFDHGFSSKAVRHLEALIVSLPCRVGDSKVDICRSSEEYSMYRRVSGCQVLIASKSWAVNSFLFLSLFFIVLSRFQGRAT
jgi:hypothetical protein